MKIDWAQALDIEHRVQKILVGQEINGIRFDVERAKELLIRIDVEQNEIYETIRPKLGFSVGIDELKNKEGYGYVKKVFTLKGDYTAPVQRWLSNAYPNYDLETCNRDRFVAGPFSRVSFLEPEFSKREKLARILIRFGWKPDVFTDTGIPMLTVKGIPVESLDRVDSDVGKGLARWFTLSHRKGVVAGWLNSVRPDGKLTPYCTGGVTNTFRRKHKCVANIPKASPKVVLGKEMRQLFIASIGMVLVGHDAAALEARVMAHYTYKYDDGEFGNEILHGDIHSLNAQRFGITRDQAKTLLYAVLYGAQPRKLQNTFGWSIAESKRVFQGFWEENKALGLLRERVIKVGNRYGYLPGIDGRAIRLRGSEHAWLNALFQSCGAIAMNYSMVFLHENCKKLGINFNQVIYYHDEIASEVLEEDVEIIREDSEKDGKIIDKSGLYYSRYGEQAVLSIRQAGTFLNMRCPLDSDYQIGNSWAEIH